MGFSSYQIERLIDRLRRWFSGPYPERLRRPDPVGVTPEGAEKSRATGPGAAPRARPAPPVPARIADERAYPPRVEAERERRAGSFMAPFIPDAVSMAIPKLRRERTPPPEAVSRGSGD